MGFIYFENGVSRYVDHYDPLPDDKKTDRKYPPKKPKTYPRGW